MFVEPATESVVWWHKAILVRWIDGDSAVVELDRSMNEFRKGLRVRLAKIDCPERYEDAGKAATAFVNELVPAGSEVLLYSHKDSTGKYGRLIAEVIYNGVNINRALVDQGHAVLDDQ